jgi:hypothetical protein
VVSHANRLPIAITVMAAAPTAMVRVRARASGLSRASTTIVPETRVPPLKSLSLSPS